MSESEGFNFYGVSVQILCEDETSKKALALLAEDFAFFSSPLKEPLDLQISLSSTKGKPARGVNLFRTRMCRVEKTLEGRQFDYGNETFSRMGRRGRTRFFEVHSKSFEEAYEVAYVILLSSVGEALDGFGWHRVHALGMSFRQRGLLVVLPQGGGKSALATLFSGSPDVRFYSDEIPLVKRGVIYPFPLRKALRPQVAEALGLSLNQGRAFRRKVFPEKWLFPFREEEVAIPSSVEMILIGRPISADDEPRVIGASRWELFFALFQTMVIGLGVPQMAEYMLRLNMVLVKISFSRLREALRLSARTEAYVFKIGPDARKNHAALLNFLKERTSSQIDAE